jgi:hypothetical protein
MAFPCDPNGEVTDWRETFCDRYETREEAIAGHARAVAKL